MTKSKTAGWYHNAGDSYEPTVRHFEKLESGSTSENKWTGPFHTFEEAKREAIAFYRDMKDTANYALRNARSIQRPEEKFCEDRFHVGNTHALKCPSCGQKA
jgi:hypothetical protein